METDLVVAKAGKRWAVVRGQQRIGYTLSRKRDAVAKMAEIIEYEVYEALCKEQDSVGAYVWTPEEEKQIADYSVLLEVNQPRWTFNGRFPIQEIARKQHAEDAAVIAGPREGWMNPDDYFREKRRIMAARVEAFRRAGIEV